MKQKLLFFFLTAFLSLTGGGKLWAGSYVISYSNISDQSNVQNGSNYDYTATLNNGLTVTYTRSESGKNLSIMSSTDHIKYSNGYHYTVSGIPNTEKIISIEFKGFPNATNKTVSIYLNNEDTGKTFTSTDAKPEQTQTVTGLSLAGGFEFHASGAETALTITITTEETTIDNVFNGTYPYTWQFDVEAAKWTKSKSQITANTTDWVVMSSGNEARNKVTTAITVNDIDICKGLTFQADAVSADASSSTGGICLDWTYRQLWMNGKLTIPNLKVGMKVKFTSEDNVTATEDGAGRVSGSGKEFTVTTAGNVTFSVNTRVQAIAVTKTDIATIGVSGGSATSAVVGSAPMNIIIVFRNESTNILTMSAEEWASCTVTNSDDAVITVSKESHSTSSGGDGRGNITVTPVAAGTSTVTISFPGSDRYNAKEGTITFTITKQTQTLSFDESTMTVNYGQTAPTNTLTQTPAVGGGAVSYSSSDPHVATWDAEKGALTIHNAGTCDITATAAETTTYAEAKASYKLTVKGKDTSELTWINNSYFPSLSGTTLAYGSNAYCFATATGTTATVKYKSSNTKIATVAVEEHGGQANACKITPTGNGEVTITAYVEGSRDVNPAEIFFIMTIEGQEVHMSFQPTSGTVKVGKTITPYISVPDIKMADITSVTVTTSDGAKATVTAGETTETSTTTYTLTKANGGLTSYTKDDTEYLEHIYATIKGEAVTSGAVTITVTVNSDIYKPTTATYQVTVNDNDLNFNWEAPSQTYTLYTGDYMMIPAITGNANGNWSYSKGSTCESEQAYLYDIKSRTPTWNNRDFKIGEGIPDYRLYESDGTTVTDKAYIVWVNGQSVHTDVLMIYAKTAGTVKLHAKDPQTGASPVDITINIIDKSTLTSATTSYVNTMSFPYTWSFVGESSIATVSPNYWEDKGDYYTCGMSTAFNFDYCDEDNDGNTGEALSGKYFVDENGIMPQFYGMTVEFGNSGGSTHSYKAKEDKLRLYKYNSNNPDQPLLQVVGGTHKIALPAPGAGCPSNYKLFVKARSRKNPAKDAILQAYWSDSKKPYYSFTNNEPIIFSVDVTSGDPVKELWVSDVDIYWIAMSTEAKNVVCPRDANSNLNYAAASYSYNADLDLSKSSEVNEDVTAYYASSYGYNADAAATGTAGYAVVMTPITTKVPANTGLILKKNTKDASTPCYMIANGQNVESYTAPDPFESGTIKNYLKATPTSGGNVSSNVTIEDQMYTNFTMAYAYKMYRDPMDAGSAYTGYLFDRDWSFYRIMGDVHFSPQKSYLQIPGNLYVDRDGKIVEGAASRRAADDNRPSTKPMLDIIFEDEPLGDPNVTGISTVSDRLIDNDAWYTLQGIRVDAPAKGGIYIHNGRKVVIK